MKRHYLIIGMACMSLMMLGACGTTCIEKATAVNALNGQIVQQANLAYDGGLIGIEAYEEIDRATTDAHAATNAALPLCLEDKDRATALLNAAKETLLSTQEQYEKESEP